MNWLIGWLTDWLNCTFQGFLLKFGLLTLNEVLEGGSSPAPIGITPRSGTFYDVKQKRHFLPIQTKHFSTSFTNTYSPNFTSNLIGLNFLTLLPNFESHPTNFTPRLYYCNLLREGVIKPAFLRTCLQTCPQTSEKNSLFFFKPRELTRNRKKNLFFSLNSRKSRGIGGFLDMSPKVEFFVRLALIKNYL